MDAKVKSNVSLGISSRNVNPTTWNRFTWEEPVHGVQCKGEYAAIDFKGTVGDPHLGLWRAGINVAGCGRDGSCEFEYTAPTGDETLIVLEGTATLTVKSTGKQFQLEAGSIVSQPKNVAVTWKIDGPFFKKFWIVWDCASPGTVENDLYVGHITDDPKSVPGDVKTWQPFTWEEQGHGTLTRGELFMLRSTGSTGSLMCGLWRSGVGIIGCEKDGSTHIPYSSPLGDEIELLLEGQFHVSNLDTGEEHHFKGGDILAIPSGANLIWRSKAPFAKKFWFITNQSP